jgi:hypothetical protein
MQDTILSNAIAAIQFERATLPNSTSPKFPIPGSEVDGRNFLNPVFRLSSQDGRGLVVSSDGATTNFGEMQKSRKPENNLSSVQDVLNQLSEGAGKALSNIGISVALTTQIDGERYAVMQYRDRDNRHMLLSGYVDAFLPDGGKHPTARGLMVSHSLEEVKQEFMGTIPPGELLAGVVQGRFLRPILNELVVSDSKILQEGDLPSLSLGRAYSALSAASQSVLPWKLEQREIPAFIHNIARDAQILFDGLPLTGVGLQYATHWNAGQLFFSYELKLPNRADISLFHAEDGPKAGGAPYELQSALSTEGLVLMKLDRDGQLTDKTYWLHAGKLVERSEFDASNIKLSEAFAGPIEGREKLRGLLNVSDISFEDYKRLAGARQ